MHSEEQLLRSYFNGSLKKEIDKLYKQITDADSYDIYAIKRDQYDIFKRYSNDTNYITEDSYSFLETYYKQGLQQAQQFCNDYKLDYTKEKANISYLLNVCKYELDKTRKKELALKTNS